MAEAFPPPHPLEALYQVREVLEASAEHLREGFRFAEQPAYETALAGLDSALTSLQSAFREAALQQRRAGEASSAASTPAWASRACRAVLRPVPQTSSARSVPDRPT